MIEAQKIQDALESLMSMVSKAMNSQALNKVIEKTEVIHQVFFKLCGLVKTQQANYVDLSLRYAFEKHKTETIMRQMAAAAGDLFFFFLFKFSGVDLILWITFSFNFTTWNDIILFNILD